MSNYERKVRAVEQMLDGSIKHIVTYYQQVVGGWIFHRDVEIFSSDGSSEPLKLSFYHSSATFVPGEQFDILEE